MTPFPRAEVFLNWLLQQTLNVSVLVMVVFLIQWLFRKHLIARWRFALWWVVLVGLLLPVRPPSSFSLYNHIHADVLLEGPRYSVPASSSPVEPVTALHSPMENRGEMADIPLAARAESNVQADEPVPVQSAVKPLSDGPPRSFWSRYLGIPGREVGWDEIAMPCYVAIWLLGVVIFSLYVGRMVFRFRRQLAGHCLPASPEVQSAFDECRRRMQVNRRVELWETEAVKSPALYGLFRLQLLLPKGLAATFSAAELRHIFLHELAHVKRGDMWLNWLVTSLQIFHWFNPFIWLAFARLRADRELACDELALIHSGEAHGQSYGQTILKLLENINQTKPMPGLVGIVEDRKQMAQRLRTIAAFRLPTKWSRLAVLLVIGLGLIGLTGAQTPVTPKSNEKQTSVPDKKAVVTNEVQQSTLQAKPDSATNSPAQTLKGRVLLPDGSPAAGAHVGFITPKGFLWIDKNQFETLGRGNVSFADRAGEFDHPLKEECFGVAALHEKGFVQVSIDDFKKNPILNLQSFGRVEGVLQIGDKAATQQMLGLMSLNYLTQNPAPQLSRIPFNVTTDKNGKFTFDSVPAGEFTIWKTFQASPTNLWSHTVYESSCLGRVIVTPGKTAAVLLGGDGVRVIGRASLWGQPWDWRNTLLSVNLSVNPFKSSNLALIESEKTRYAYMQSEEFKALMRTQRYYTLVVKEDGTVEASDVPPGTYQLRLEAKQNLAPPGERYSMAKLKLLASLKKEIIIPEPAKGKPAVFDLGELVLEREAAQAPAAVKPDKEQAAISERQPSVIGDVPRFTVGAKSEISTNASQQVFKGKVLDAVTRQPVTNFTMIQRASAPPGAWAPKTTEYSSPTGTYDSPVQNAAKIVKASFSAAGYQVKDLELTQADLQREHEVFLRKADAHAGRVLLPDGKPAAGAFLAFRSPKNPVVFGVRRFLSYSRQPVMADADGSFQQIPEAGCDAIAALHEDGVAIVSIEDFLKNAVIQLRPWGRVEGTLHIGEKLGSGRQVLLQQGMLPFPSPTDPMLDNRAFSGTTDENGKFRFESVPPGEFMIAIGRPLAPTNSFPRHFVLTCTSQVVVSPGETTEVAIGGNGLRISGHVVLQSKPFEWSNTFLYASLNTAIAGSRQRSAEEKDPMAYFHSEEYRGQLRSHRTYGFAVNEDGSIEATDVPPGKYHLNIRMERNVTGEKSTPPSQYKLLGSMEREIVIPEPATGKPLVFDLGELVLEREAAQAPAAVKPDKEQGATSEKQPIVIGAVPRFAAGAKAEDTTNTPSHFLKGKVLDAATHKPVTNFSVEKWEVAFRADFNPGISVFSSETGSFNVPIFTLGRQIQVSFIAPGYELLQFDLTLDQVRQEQEILLKAGTDYQGRVLLPDGTPAIGAEVAFLSPKHSGAVGKRRFDGVLRANMSVVDANGSFRHPQVADCSAITVVHSQGFFHTSLDAFKKDPVIRLQAWGRVEGTFRIGDKPGVGHEFTLHPLYAHLAGLHLSDSAFKVKTDEVGKFIFESVPPGEFILSRTFHTSPTNAWSYIYVQNSYGANVSVAPGKTVTLSLGGDGVRVTGRALLQGQPWNWSDTHLFASLDLKQLDVPPPLTPRSPQEIQAYFRSDEYKKEQRARRSYALTVKEDGAIEVFDVPPGTYNLFLGAKQNLDPKGGPVSFTKLKSLADLKKEVVIPEPATGKRAVLDLGNLVLEPANQ